MVAGGERRRAGFRVWAYLACAWCVVFAAVHLYWAMGGDAGLASSAGTALATRRPLSFVVFGLWGTALVLLVGAAFSIGLARWRPYGGLRRWMVILGFLVGVALLVRGLLLEVVLLAGVGGVASAVGPLETYWSLILWNPWFMLGGLLLILAAHRFRRAGR